MCPSNLLCLFLLLCLPLLAIDVKANGQSWTCDRSSLAGYVDKPIEPMKCRLYITAIPYVYPPLPSGLVARFVVDPIAILIKERCIPFAPRTMCLSSLWE